MLFDYSKQPLVNIYGKFSFSESVMRKRLDSNIFNEFKQVQHGEKKLTQELANIIAQAMKEWAIENGATHYSHWFQPLTGLTAEKHDSFIQPLSDGTVIMEFSGKELLKGESDASSFPNGGLRATFEARGYTAWDVTSPAFLKHDKAGITLTIPTAFFSHTSDALDKKTPLLRSMESINRAGIRVLRALGNKTSQRILTTVGPEQEYFLIDKEHYDKRIDLKLSGRTVFGSLGAKGQELDDHYFGVIKERIGSFMHELNHELWELGISAKTQHKEVAPSQFELATIFDTANVSTDKNQLVMEIIKKIAIRHNLVALLHEKPFAGVNGSGKHNNWSLSTDDGVNIFNPGETPEDNAQFLLFLVAVIKAIDVYAPLLRASAANAGNDYRLGANEAPPAIISIFIGEQLQSILENLVSGKKNVAQKGDVLEIGVTSFPPLPKESTDRNRTSPFAFTCNKFEFRMVGSSQSLSSPNVVLNSAVAEVLTEFADVLEKASDINEAVANLVKTTYSKHKRIVFNGNGYSVEWEKEAQKRGLANIKSTVLALREYVSEGAIKLFENQNVFSRSELFSREEIYFENYSKSINIEAGCMIEMSNKMIFPAVLNYLNELSSTIINLKKVGVGDTSYIKELVKNISSNLNKLKQSTETLEKMVVLSTKITNQIECGDFFKQNIIPQMEKVRSYGDYLEKVCDKKIWPFPTYEDMLFEL